MSTSGWTRRRCWRLCGGSRTISDCHSIQPRGAWGHEFATSKAHWDEPDFHLALLYPWLPQAKDLLATGDARGLERLLMDGAWRRLDRCAQQNTFGFEAVFSYFFKWDILRAWLACDAEKAKTRFQDLIDQVTHVEHN